MLWVSRIWTLQKKCPKIKKDNNKRGREEAHVTKEVEQAEKKKSKIEEVRDLSMNDIVFLT